MTRSKTASERARRLVTVRNRGPLDVEVRGIRLATGDTTKMRFDEARELWERFDIVTEKRPRRAVPVLTTGGKD